MKRVQTRGAISRWNIDGAENVVESIFACDRLFEHQWLALSPGSMGDCFSNPEFFDGGDVECNGARAEKLIGTAA